MKAAILVLTGICLVMWLAILAQRPEIVCELRGGHWHDYYGLLGEDCYSFPES